MDWLSFLVPGFALRRAVAIDRLRAYEAAGRPLKWSSWLRPPSSARAEVAGAGKVRDSVRDLLRNNGYAQRAHRTLCRATIGTGIVGSLLTPAGKPANAAARDAFERWADHCDFEGHHDLYGQQLLVARTVYESGGALLRFHRHPAADDRVAPVSVQVLEEDYIDEAKTAALADGGWIDRGIEYDARGRRRALWLLPEHPGDRTLISRHRPSERLLASEVQHVYDRLRPGQDRGMSIFAGAVAPIRDLQSYFDAELMRKKIEACLSVFVTTPDGDSALLGTEPERRDGADTTRLVPGMVHRLQPGETVTTLEPRGTADVKMFSEQILFLAAAAGGVMFEHMTGNMEKVNYSSYRVGSYDFAGFIEQQQWLMFRPRMCVPIADAFLDAATTAGLLHRPHRVRWTPPPAVTSPDPEKDARADLLQMGMGAKALSEVAESRGWTLAELLERIKADRAAAAALGLRLNDGSGGLKPSATATKKETDDA